LAAVASLGQSTVAVEVAVEVEVEVAVEVAVEVEVDGAESVKAGDDTHQAACDGGEEKVESTRSPVTTAVSVGGAWPSE
jgi:hypothetical protein